MNEATCTRLVRRRATAFDPALDEFGYIPCEACGMYPQSLERHHRQFRSRGGLWTPSNVVLLCHDCHEGATDEAPWVTGTGLNVHTWEDPREIPVRLWYVNGLVLLDDVGGYTVVDKA